MLEYKNGSLCHSHFIPSPKSEEGGWLVLGLGKPPVKLVQFIYDEMKPKPGCMEHVGVRQCRE